MLILENVLLALSGLKSNKMRTLLTMLGIIIGIAAVIAIMTVGDSINTSVTTSMQEMGANNLTVGLKKKSSTEEVTSNGMRFGAGGQRSISEDNYITEQMVSELNAAYGEKIKCISLSESVGTGTAEDANLSANVSLIGVNTGYLETNDLTMITGRSLTDQDQAMAKKVVLVSDKLVENLFAGDYVAALESTIDVNLNNRYYTYTIVGVYEYEETSTFSQESDEEVTTTVYMPLDTARNQNHTTTGYIQFTVVTNTDVDTSTFMEEVEIFFHIY